MYWFRNGINGRVEGVDSGGWCLGFSLEDGWTMVLMGEDEGEKLRMRVGGIFRLGCFMDSFRGMRVS